MRNPLQRNQKSTIVALVTGALIWPLCLYLKSRRK